MSYFITLVFLLSFPALASECSFLSHRELGRQVLAAFSRTPFSCQPNAVHMTFDDGPSPSVTPDLLKELSRRNVKASFFITTTNLENSHPRREDNRRIIQNILGQGHLLASHGHNHDAHDLRIDGNGNVLSSGMSNAEREREVQRSTSLLDEASGGAFSRQKTQLFRFPYGRGAMPSERELNRMVQDGLIHLEGNSYAERLREYRRISPALQVTAHAGFSHLGWNHDSRDSALGGNISGTRLTNYILENLRSLCSPSRVTKVALFHDIKPFNKEAIPVILDLGKCLGLNFISAGQMLRERESLVDTGVLIPRESTIAAPARTIEELIARFSGGPRVENCDSDDAKNKTCYSQYTQRNYRHCEGESSICFEGRWYAAHDPIVEGCRNP